MASNGLDLEQLPSPTEWAQFGTINIKFKCKCCDFETEDLPELRSHHEQTHVYGPQDQEQQQQPATSIAASTFTEGNVRKRTSTRTSGRSTPIEPSTERGAIPFLPSRLHKIEAGVQSPSSASEIYLCSECNITFESDASCYEHMTYEHGLEELEFNEFNQNLLLNQQQARPNQRHQRNETKPLHVESESPSRFLRTSTRKSRPPRLMTLEEGGVVVPKKFRKDSKRKCTLCPAKFEQVEILEIHQQCHNRKKDLGISRVSVNTSGEEEEQPKRQIAGYSCVFCKMNRPQPSESLEESSEDPATVKFYKWGQCALHLWRVHNIDCELYQCHQCSFKTYAKSTLAEHQNIHGITSKFKCKICHKSFKQLSQLKNHEKFHREKSTKLPPPGDERWYTPKVCPICSRVLSDQKCLKRHISYVHNKLKQHVCNVCGHLSARKNELQLHMRQHTGEKPFKCTVCSFATIDPNSLRRHKATHTKKFTYSCSYCDYKCIQTNALKLHLKTSHPNEEGYFRCAVCPFESVNSTLFEAHMKGHTEAELAEIRTATAKNVSDEDSNDTNSNSMSNHTTDSRSSLNEAEGESEKTTQISVRKQSWLQEDSSSRSSGNEEVDDEEQEPEAEAEEGDEEVEEDEQEESRGKGESAVAAQEQESGNFPAPDQPCGDKSSSESGNQ